MARAAPHILIISARFYTDIADKLEQGAQRKLSEQGATSDIIHVPGALEIPMALSLACNAGIIPFSANKGKYHGCIALGCVIRGETTHYELVSNESSRVLMDVACDAYIPIGNGILTVENRDQALARLVDGESHKGEGAAQACLSLIDHMSQWYKLS